MGHFDLLCHGGSIFGIMLFLAWIFGPPEEDVGRRNTVTFLRSIRTQRNRTCKVLNGNLLCNYLDKKFMISDALFLRFRFSTKLIKTNFDELVFEFLLANVKKSEYLMMYGNMK